MANELLRDFVLAHRKRLGLSQDALAKLCGLSNAWFGRLESGTIKGRPKFITVQKLAAGLGLTQGEVMVAAGYLNANVLIEAGSVDRWEAKGEADPETAAIYEELQHLTPERRRLLLALAKSWNQD